MWKVTEMMRKMCLIQIEKETGLLEQYIKLGAFKETIIYGINATQYACIWEVFQEESEQYVLPLALFCMIRSGTRLLWCYSSLWWGSINVSTQSYLLSLKSIDPQDLTTQCKKEEQDFFDVTLARDDEQFYSHKVIRWAWSPFFCKILLHNVEEEPCLFEANLYDWKPPSVRTSLCQELVRGPENHTGKVTIS